MDKSKHLKDKKKRKLEEEVNEEEESVKVNSYLSPLYYTLSQPASYSGLNKLWSIIQKKKDRPLYITRKNVARWLESQQVHRIHRAPKKHFKTEAIIMGQVDEQWEADLISMIPQSRQNKGYKYICLFVDVFSKYLWLEPLKTKQGKEVAQAIKKVFKEGRKPLVLRTDQGEYY